MELGLEGKAALVTGASEGITTDWKRLKDAGVEFVEDPTNYGNSGSRRSRTPRASRRRSRSFEAPKILSYCHTRATSSP